MENNDTKKQMETAAREKYEKLTPAQKEQLAKRIRQPFLIILWSSIIGCVAFTILTILTIVGVLSSDGVAAIILLWFASIGFIIWMSVYLKKTPEQLIINRFYQQEVQKNQFLEKNPLYGYSEMPNGFTVSRKIALKVAGFTKQTLYIDKEKSQFVFQKNANYTAAYLFSDILNYEIYENGASVVKGTAGRALIGGVFFGLGGMIVGSSMSRGVDGVCKDLKLIIRLNNIDTPQLVVQYTEDVDISKSSDLYNQMRASLQEISSCLEFMLNNKGEGKAIQPTENGSLKTQLTELKELLDAGLITADEFEQKKKKLLGL